MSTRSSPAPFLRWHGLSSEAVAYRARRKPSVPFEMPDLTDHAAVARWRAETNALWGEEDDPAVPHRREVIGGVACLVAGPPPDVGAPRGESVPAGVAAPSGAGVPVVVYAHGGGYVLGSAAVAIPITARLGRTLRVVSVDYRQPPEHPFPAALDDILAVYAALAAGDTPVTLAGDSAGGALALSTAVTAAVQGQRPVAVALFSPLLDHVAVPGNPLADNKGHRLIDHYAGEADPADPRLSPLRAELGGLPPVLVQAAADEPLAVQAVELHRRATAAGVDVTLDLWEHMWHTWHYHDLPEADQALAEAAAFLAAPFSSSGGT
ncbi:MAG: alpha/beta hydrolase [Acidimicrobiaceae bacterium]|nr:alpha/beta hydrolase [Acidimicrobiaceae bacterium]